MAFDRRVVLAMAAALSGAGCGLFRASQPPAEPALAPVDLEIAAAERLNPDEHGDSLPTVVMIYQLKSAARLEGADFDRLYRDAKEALGPDLLRAEEVTLSPGETLRRRVERDRSARVLALVALVRRPSGISWRVLAELPPPATRAQLGFLVEGYRIERR
jgi:type VI secretion system protein VasD